MPDIDLSEFDFAATAPSRAPTGCRPQTRRAARPHIHASLQGEYTADALLALVQLLGIWLSSEPLERQITGLAVISRLITQQLLGDGRRCRLTHP